MHMQCNYHVIGVIITFLYDLIINYIVFHLILVYYIKHLLLNSYPVKKNPIYNNNQKLKKNQRKYLHKSMVIFSVRFCCCCLCFVTCFYCCFDYVFFTSNSNYIYESYKDTELFDCLCEFL